MREAHAAVVEGRATSRKHGRKGGPVAGNRFLDVAGPFFAWALKEDRLEANHVLAIRMAPEKPRDRTLSHDEIRAVWRASQAMGTYGRLVRFLLLTACREGEALEMHHGDVLDALWRKRQVTGANKSGKAKRLRLPALALAEIGSGDPRDRVFPGERGGKFGNLSICKKRLDAASGVTGWTLHDLRRSAASAMQELKVGPHVIRFAILDHTAKGLDAVYLLGDLTAPAGEALERWANEVPPWARIAAVADDMAKAAVGLVESIDHRTDVRLAAAVREIELGVRKPDAARVAWAESVQADAAEEPRLAGMYARETLAMVKYPDRVKLLVQAMRIGGLRASPRCRARCSRRPAWTSSSAARSSRRSTSASPTATTATCPRRSSTRWAATRRGSRARSYLEVDAVDQDPRHGTGAARAAVK